MEEDAGAAGSGLTEAEGRARAGIVLRWLETDDTFRVPKEADFLLGSPEDGYIKGMLLSDNDLSGSYHGNFFRLAGSKPRPLNISMTVEECGRLAAAEGRIHDIPIAETQAARVARSLAAEGPASGA